MEIENKKYDAFISYRHAELDKFVAETLHKELEKFKVPKQIQKEKGRDKSICIFRDQDELPISSNLADPITVALKNSEFLIVICSPRLLESQWCKREIETFISLHGRNKIFTVLIEGEPKDSFPEQLLYEEVEEFDESGNVVIKNKEIEPLAADVRGKNFAQVKNKIKHERLRILAPMLGLGYDDLRQRHKERAMKHAMAISAGIAAALLGFSTISTVMALEIREQSNKISEQSDKILKQNRDISVKAAEINHQSEQIKKQYEEAQMSYSKSLADASSRILRQGDRMAAVYTARSGMPGNLENPEKPYTPECEYALVNAMYLYQTEDAFVPNNVYQTDGAVQSMKTSEDGTYLLISDSTDQIYLWDTETHELLLQVQGKEGMDCNMIQFMGEDKIIYDTEKGICIENFKTKDVTCLDRAYDLVVPYPDGKHYLTLSFNGLCCYNSEDSSLIFKREDYSFWPVSPDKVRITDDGSRIIILDTIAAKPQLAVIDAKNGDILYTQLIPSDFANYCCENGKVLVTAFLKKNASNFDVDMICIDTQKCNVLWEKLEENTWVNGIHYIVQGKKEYYYLFRTNGMTTYDAKTGNQICSNEYSQNIINSYALKTKETEMALCDDGTMLLYYIASGELSNISRKIEYIDYKVNDFIWTPGNIFTQPKGGNQVIQYMIPDYEKTKIADLPDEDRYGRINKDNSLTLNEYIIGSDHYVGLKDLKTGVMKAKVKVSADNSYLKYFFVGDGQEQFAVIQDDCTVYSTTDGAVLRTIEVENKGFGLLDWNWSSDGRLLYVQVEDESIFNEAISTESGEVVMKVPLCEQKIDIKTIFSNDCSSFACYDGEKDELRLYHPGEEQPYVTKKVSLADTQKILFSDDGKYLCVAANNGNACFYDATTMELVKTLYDENINMPESIQYIDSIHRYIIKVSGGAYLLDEEFNYVAAIPYFLDLDSQNQKISIKINQEIDTIPYYSYDTMIKEADKLLEGYRVTEELKRKYNVE